MDKDRDPPLFDVSKLPVLQKGEILLIYGTTDIEQARKICRDLTDMNYAIGMNAKVMFLPEGVTLQTIPRDEAIKVLEGLVGENA